MKKYYTESGLKGLNLREEEVLNIANCKAESQAKLMQLRQFVPEASLYYGFYIQERERCFVNCRIGFERGGVRIFLLPYQSKKDLFYIDYDAYKHVSRTEICNFPFTEPNYIGMYTKKKVDAWIDYLLNVHYKAVELDKERAQKIETFFREIERIGGYRGDCGEIERNGVLYSWKIENGHIYQWLKLSAQVRANLDNFKALAVNNFSVVNA